MTIDPAALNTVAGLIAAGGVTLSLFGLIMLVRLRTLQRRIDAATKK